MTPCRFDSEIGILEYVCCFDEQVLKACVRELLQEGFQPKKNLDAKENLLKNQKNYNKYKYIHTVYSNNRVLL